MNSNKSEITPTPLMSSIPMKLSHRLTSPAGITSVALVLFGISHFLPAVEGGSGFQCFQGCWGLFWELGSQGFSWGWLYYSGFMVSNIGFLILGIAMLVSQKARLLSRNVSLVFLLHTLSWLIIHLNQGLSDIKIGYYVWLTAYALLFIAHLRKPNTEADAGALQP